MDSREASSDAVHEALPVPSAVGQPVRGTGDDATAALRDLNERLRGIPKADGGRRDELRRWLRLAYMDGAEQWTRENVGRGMTGDELEGVLRRFRPPTP